VISPQVYVNKTSFHANHYRTTKAILSSVSLQYYFTNNFAFGLQIVSDYHSSSPKTTNIIFNSRFTIKIMPEIQYNILKTRLTPFFKVQLFDSNFTYVSRFFDNPAVSKNKRKFCDYYYSLNNFNFGVTTGVRYAINRKIGIITMVNFPTIRTFSSTNISIGVGGQFTIN
jgi:hypothetical protein